MDLDDADNAKEAENDGQEVLQELCKLRVRKNGGEF